jgi:hypothetical protein
MNGIGFKVLRFSNSVVFKNMEGVVREIYDHLKKIPPNPPLEKGGNDESPYPLFKKGGNGASPNPAFRIWGQLPPLEKEGTMLRLNPLSEFGASSPL